MSGTGPRRRGTTAPGRAPRRLTGLELAEVSLVDAPANVGARHLLAKIDAPDGGDVDPAAEMASLRERIATAEAGRAAADAARDELEGMLAVLAEGAPMAPAPAPAAPAAPAAAEAAPPPVRTAYEQADIELSGLALIARDTPDKGSRSFWRQQVSTLGRHLLPGEPPTRQTAAALDDPRGQAFVEALQSRPA